MVKQSSPPEEATHSERIASLIEEQIVSGERLPGSHLNEQDLADQFKVSRTPIREAVRHLASTGLAEMRPRRGAVVAQIPITRLIQMFETMSELEGVCARLCARRMDDETKKALKKTHDSYASLAKGDDADAYYEASLQFHFEIFSGTQNQVLADMANGLFRRLNAYRRRQLRQSNRVGRSFDEHQEVLDAILVGDEDAAERLMKLHTRVVSDNVMDFISLMSPET